MNVLVVSLILVALLVVALMVALVLGRESEEGRRR